MFSIAFCPAHFPVQTQPTPLTLESYTLFFILNRLSQFKCKYLFFLNGETNEETPRPRPFSVAWFT